MYTDFLYELIMDADGLHMVDNYKTIFYRIADLFLEVRLPKQAKSSQLLPSFEAFLDQNINNQEPISVVTLVLSASIDAMPDGRLLMNNSEVWGEHFKFYETTSGYITIFQHEKNPGAWRMDSSRNFDQSIIIMHPQNEDPEIILSWMIMLTYGQACVYHKAILLHASVIECEKMALAFLGPSGTGKSTHSRMWLENIQGASLLNDDNPAIRILDKGEVYVYGTPWSGKTPCYRAEKVKLHGLVRIHKAKFNRITKKEGLEAFTTVLPSCTAIRWNTLIFNHMLDTISSTIKSVQVAELECLPNSDAAHLCYKDGLKN